jgi:nucleoside-diphosphate-sugar epimerase
MDKCISFKDKVKWIDTDSENWKSEAIKFSPDIILHSAWCGVENEKRNDWNIQLSNINFLYNLLKIEQETNIKKIICLGSQAEYGVFDDIISEEDKVNPVTSYGIIKLANLEFLKSFCEDKKIEWYWMRIFSVLGENDNSGWLLPTVISKLQNNTEIELTGGEQKYDYIYIQDLCEMIHIVIESRKRKSGIYNLCTGKSIKIKDMLSIAAEKLAKPKKLLKFGTIPYRPDQTMNIVGNVSKFEKNFGKIDFMPIDLILNKIINNK